MYIKFHIINNVITGENLYILANYHYNFIDDITEYYPVKTYWPDVFTGKSLLGEAFLLSYFF